MQVRVAKSHLEETASPQYIWVRNGIPKVFRPTGEREWACMKEFEKKKTQKLIKGAEKPGKERMT